MNSTDSKFVEAMINGVSNFVTVKRDANAVFGKGSSTNNPPASFTIDTSHNTIRVSVDGKAPVSITFPVPSAASDIVSAINTALTGVATAKIRAAIPFVITSATTSDHSSVVVMPGLRRPPHQELPRHLTGGATAMPPILLQNLNVFADGVRPGDFAVALFSLPR
jgi:hypothetical protein